MIYDISHPGIGRTDGSVKCNVKHLMSFLTHLKQNGSPILQTLRMTLSQINILLGF